MDSSSQTSESLYRAREETDASRGGNSSGTPPVADGTPSPRGFGGPVVGGGQFACGAPVEGGLAEGELGEGEPRDGVRLGSAWRSCASAVSSLSVGTASRPPESAWPVLLIAVRSASVSRTKRASTDGVDRPVARLHDGAYTSSAWSSWHRPPGALNDTNEVPGGSGSDRLGLRAIVGPRFVSTNSKTGGSLGTRPLGDEARVGDLGIEGVRCDQQIDDLDCAGFGRTLPATPGSTVPVTVISTAAPGRVSRPRIDHLPVAAFQVLGLARPPRVEHEGVDPTRSRRFGSSAIVHERAGGEYQTEFRLPRVEGAAGACRRSRRTTARRAPHRRDRAPGPRRAGAHSDGHHGLVQHQHGSSLPARQRPDPAVGREARRRADLGLRRSS